MRDLVGYGWNYPKIVWPEEARVVVSLVLNYEEGSELCVGDGDPQGERVGEFVYPSMDADTRDMGIESTFEYGARVGTWRVLDLLDEFGAKATIFACGRAFERNPLLARTFTQRGHEVAGHGYRWSITFACPSITSASRSGWRSSRSRTPAASGRSAGIAAMRPASTRAACWSRKAAFSTIAIPTPTRSPTGSRSAIAIISSCRISSTPTTRSSSGGQVGRAGEFWEYLRDSVDCLVREGAKAPKMLSVGLHGRIIGRPGRSTALARFLEYCRKTPGVSFQRRVDIARWWHQHYRP